MQTTLEVQRKLLSKTKTEKTNALLKKSMKLFLNNCFIDVYDTVGSNGIFSGTPSVVKFAGFEIRKTHTQRVRLINNSPAP